MDPLRPCGCLSFELFSNRLLFQSTNCPSRNTVLLLMPIRWHTSVLMHKPIWMMAFLMNDGVIMMVLAWAALPMYTFRNRTSRTVGQPHPSPQCREPSPRVPIFLLRYILIPSCFNDSFPFVSDHIQLPSTSSIQSAYQLRMASIASGDSALEDAVAAVSKRRVSYASRDVSLRYLAILRLYFIPFLQRAILPSGSLFPISPELANVFVASRMHDTGYASTGEHSINAIQWLHRVFGYTTTKEHFATCRKGIDILRRKTSKFIKRCAIASADEIQHIFEKALADDANLVDSRLAAIISAQLGGYARCIDILDISHSEIFISSNHIDIILAHAKTDAYRIGHTIRIMRSPGRYCLCRFLEAYLHQTDLFYLPDSSVEMVAPIFRRLTFRKGRGRYLSEAKIDSSHVSRNTIAADLKKCLSPFGDGSSSLTLHSFRAAPATVAAAAKVPLAVIKRQGRWSPSSTSVHNYIAPSQEVIQQPSIIVAEYINRLGNSTSDDRQSQPVPGNPRKRKRTTALLSRPAAITHLPVSTTHTVSVNEFNGLVLENVK